VECAAKKPRLAAKFRGPRAQSLLQRGELSGTGNVKF